jgi:segregation and condensation protein A
VEVSVLESGGRGEMFVVEIERFQGPLDLLLHLIRQQDIDIFDIPISRITDQFLRTIEGISPAELDNAGEFLEMAATLIRIKAQMLLPRHGEDDDDDPRAELVRRLLEYEQIREVASRLSSAEAERGRKAGKGYVPTRPRPAPMDTPLETTWDEVYAAALLVTLPDPRAHEHRVSARTVSMEEKANLILERLSQSSRVEFSKLLDEFRDRMHGVMTLLAGLELSRRREIFLRQIRPFAELWLYLREDAGEAGGDAQSEEDETTSQPGPGTPQSEYSETQHSDEENQ